MDFDCLPVFIGGEFSADGGKEFVEVVCESRFEELWCELEELC